MASRLRCLSVLQIPEDTTPMKLLGSLKSKYRYLEFKYLYFQMQQLLDKEVVLSFRYEQLKTPEIRLSLIKPLVSKIIDMSSLLMLKNTFSSSSSTLPNLTSYETPQFGPVGYGLLSATDSSSSSKISSCVIYVLLLLRYEYMIQSESHLIMYDLLVTKATICEFLAIRMLREYSSTERINLLFINPMVQHDEHEQLKHTKHLDSFNTLELSILSKSKKFLVQPVIIGILDRIYNGELIMRDKVTSEGRPRSCGYPTSTSRGSDSASLAYKRGYYRDFERGTVDVPAGSTESDNFEKSIVNYKFNQITLKKVFFRSNVVPKYQSLVINLKYGFLTFLFLIIVFKHRYNNLPGYLGSSMVLPILFWVVALSFNLDVVVKFLHIEYRFLKKIIWTYIDILIVTLIDVSFVLRILLSLDKIHSQTYHNCFSLISILLFPRMLSVFNNYEFFNMIIVSLKKMMWNVIAMFCLFTSLIFGFFLCFISLTKDMSTSDVAFAMLKLFFGFTPAVWDNWGSYDNLGRALQLGYLSLIQFVLTTILAIVLSNIFAKVSETNKEEFEYLKTTNLIIYLKWAKFQLRGASENKFTVLFDYVVKLSKLPIILIIYSYEILIKENKKLVQKQRKGLKHFTFLNREEDLYGDTDMLNLNQLVGEEDVSSLRLSSRRGSHIDARVASGGEASVAFAANTNSGAYDVLPRKKSPSRKIMPQQSQATIAGFRSGLLDSMFIDDFLGKRYGAGRFRKVSEMRLRRVLSEVETAEKFRQLNEELMQKMTDLQELVLQLVNARSNLEQRELDDYEVREYHKDCNDTGSLGDETETEEVQENMDSDESASLIY